MHAYKITMCTGIYSYPIILRMYMNEYRDITYIPRLIIVYINLNMWMTFVRSYYKIILMSPANVNNSFHFFIKISKKLVCGELQGQKRQK